MMQKSERPANESFWIATTPELVALALVSKTKVDARRGKDDPWKQVDFFYTLQEVSNLFLAYQRLVPRSNKDDKDQDQDKKKFLDAIVELAGSLTSSDVQACNARLKDQLNAYKQQGWEKASLDTKGLPTQWRLVVGLGGESVLETSMTLHHLYGFPYVPASAVKGIARAYALYAEGKACDNDDFRLNPSARTDATATNIFGSQDRAGQVIFFDAFPTEFPKLDVDVINVHYQEYYSSNGTVPPGDWMSPVPNFFLTVAPNARFNFYLASRDGELLAQAKEWLYQGLTQLGIGGKTSAGYGYFSEATPVEAVQEENLNMMKAKLSQSGLKVSTLTKKK